jgi:hypothetical protein
MTTSVSATNRVSRSGEPVARRRSAGLAVVATVAALSSATCEPGPSTVLFAPRSDETAPAILDVGPEAITAASATIRWTTSEAASGRVEYGTTAALGSWTPAEATRSMSHSAALSGLEPGTLYHYRVTAADSARRLRHPPRT